MKLKLPYGDGLSRRKREALIGSLVTRLAVERSNRDPDDLLRNLLVQIGSSLGAVRCAVILNGDGQRTLAAEWFSGDAGRTPAVFDDLDKHIALRLDAEGEFLEWSGVRSDPTITRHAADIRETTGCAIESAAAIALDPADDGAALLVYANGRGGRAIRDRELLKSLAVLVGHTMLNRFARVEEETGTRSALTNGLLTAIRNAPTTELMLKVAVESVGIMLRASRVAFYLPNAARDNGGGRLMMHRPTASVEFRHEPAIPSVVGTELNLQGTELLARMLAGEVVVVGDMVEAEPVTKALAARLGARALMLAPINYASTKLAALVLEQFDSPRHFTEEEAAILRLVAEQTSVALYKAELFQELQDAARSEAIIRRISSAVHRSLDQGEVLQTIVNELATQLKVCRCRLALLPSPLPEEVPITHSYSADCCRERLPQLRAIPVTGNLHFQKVIRSDLPVPTDDVENDPRISVVRENLIASGVKSLLVAPIKSEGKPIGLLSLHHCEQLHTWTQWEIDVVRSVAEQAAVAIRQAELYREAREAATRAALVNQIVAAIRRSLDLKQTIQVAVEELGKALEAGYASFARLDGDRPTILAEYAGGAEEDPTRSTAPLSEELVTRLRETRRTLVMEDAGEEIAPSGDGSGLSHISSPIFVHGELWGVLSLTQTDGIGKWTPGQLEMVEAVSAQVEVAVSHSHLFEEAHRVARREALASRIIHGVNQSNRLDEIFPIVSRELADYLAADSIMVARLDRPTGLWTIECEYTGGRVSHPHRAYDAKEYEDLVGRLREGPIVSSDVESDDRLIPYLDRMFRPFGHRAAIIVGLFYKGVPGLALVATMQSGPRNWSEEEIEVMRAAASHVFVAMERAELFEQVSLGKHEWETTFDALTDGIFIFDRDGTLRRVNEAGAAFEGTAARNMIGRRCCTILQGIEGEQCRVQSVIGSGRPITFELTPERLSRPVLVTISPLSHWYDGHESGRKGDDGQRDSRGVAAGVVCVVRDLSELRAAEAAAREQRSFLAKLIEHANDAIFTLSPQGRFLWFNDQLTRLSGYSHEELKHMDYRRFVPPDETHTAVERFQGALAGLAQTFEMQGLKKGGEARLLLMTYTPIYDEGQVTSVLCIAKDVTAERIAREQAAQADKLRALGQLASGVAHNFNNILAAVLGHAQLIKRESDDERTQRRIEIIERATLDGAETVKRIQSFGQQGNGSDYVAVDLNHLVEDSTTLTRARWQDDAQSRGIHYDVQVDLGSTPLIKGSPSELREVFVNIILNALDAMPKGGRLLISTEATEASAMVRFSDNGLGMDHNVRNHVFEPFFTTKVGTGMGLGLAVSYGTIERHGGEILVESEPGQGATFVLRLPIANAHERVESNGRARAVPSSRILVVEDDDLVRGAMVGMLRECGHQTDQASNGREALKKLESSTYDLVLTDLSMPELDGWGVASRVREQWPATKIIMMTGFALAPDAVPNQKDLVDALIHKPFRFDDISSTVSLVLSQ